MRIVAQNGVKRQKHLNFRFKTDFAPLPWASKSIKIVKKWMKMIDMIEIRFALYYFSHFFSKKKILIKIEKKKEVPAPSEKCAYMPIFEVAPTSDHPSEKPSV